MLRELIPEVGQSSNTSFNFPKALGSFCVGDYDGGGD